MAVAKSSKSPKPRGKNGKVHGKSLLVAQEISFAKVLAGNDKKLRDRGVKRLKKWLSARSHGAVELDEDDFMRIWKGLFYCMWMSDKPLIQEDLAESISSLVHCFKSTSSACRFIKTFFVTMSKEWRGIDQHRLDKFLMLVRRFLRQSLLLVKEQKWEKNVVSEFCQALMLSLLPDHTAPPSKLHAPLGLVMHFTDIFLEELAKVSEGNLREDTLLQILRLFVGHIAVSKEGRIVGHIQRHIFRRLIEQSPQGIEYQEKFRAWKKLGFPGGTIDVMEREEVSEDEDEGMNDDHEDEDIQNATRPLDPRAGRIDVELPVISFNPESVAKLILEYRFKKYTNSKTRKTLANLAKKFEQLSSGEFPWGIKTLPEDPGFDFKSMTEKAAEELIEYEEALKHMNVEDETGDSGENAFETHDDADDEETIVEEVDEDGSEEDEEEDVDDESVDDDDQDDNEEDDNEDDVSEQEVEEVGEEVNNDEHNKNINDYEVLKTEEPTGTPNNSGRRKSSVVRNKLVQNSPWLISSYSQSTIKQGSPKASECTNSKTSLKIKNSSKTDSGMLKNNDCKIVSSKRVKKSSAELSEVVPKKRRHSGGEFDANLKENGRMEDAEEVVPLPAANTLIHRLASNLGSTKKGRRVSLPATLGLSQSKSISDTHVQTEKSKSPKHISAQKKDPWNEPLQDGETEIFIPRSAIIAKRRSLQVANEALQTPDAVVKNPFASPSPAARTKTPSSSSKKVNFVLQRNTAQATSEYLKTLRANPDIPYDASKKPSHGVLKQSPYNSPINPFYKKKLKM